MAAVRFFAATGFAVAFFAGFVRDGAFFGVDLFTAVVFRGDFFAAAFAGRCAAIASVIAEFKSAMLKVVADLRRRSRP